MNLGTLKVADLSAQYAPGSFMATATFDMENLTFVARRFKRTDSHKVDNYELYIAHESSWCDDFIKYIDPHSTNLSRVDRRAVHLLDVATASTHDGMEERFNLLEML